MLLLVTLRPFTHPADKAPPTVPAPGAARSSNRPEAPARPPQVSYRRVALITAAFLVLPAALMVLSLMRDASRGRQRLSMADMRIVGTALEGYHEEHGSYPVASGGDAATWKQLEALLAPFATGPLADRDAWGHLLVIQSTATDYTLRSLGSDGRMDAPLAAGGDPLSAGVAMDIVFVNGAFVQYPMGSM